MTLPCGTCTADIVMVLNDSPGALAGRPRLYVDPAPVSTNSTVGTVAARKQRSRRYGLHPVWQGHRIRAGESAHAGYQLFDEHHCKAVA